ncbi:MAG: NAD(P)H-dependent glycerol-3-phosphate dehydrogenase [Mariprofundaceae bacterium]|nr:NAD(P)H-dependent glycerol-3-phosphate dehydrogenase [Mariprofundaceae bacterium]
MKQTPVAVLGAGSWGTALAMVLSRCGREVHLFERNGALAREMQKVRRNNHFLPGITFPESLSVTADYDKALKGTAATVLAVPCSAADSVLSNISGSSTPVIAACKGLNPDSLERVDELLIRHVGIDRAALLSGPSFARDSAEGLPTAITMAAADLTLARQCAELFDDPAFRIYTSTDMAGVALGGALKNVIAIAAGISSGLNLGHSAVAALITRGIVEISRLAVACGGKPETMSGLSGLGDLVLTCTGELSRNRKMGIALAQGMSVDEARTHVGQVVEGEKTAIAACKLAEQHGIEMPISEIVRSVLEEKIRPDQAVSQLLNRPEKAEYT